MKTTLIDLFTSKKFLAALTAIVVYVAGRFGFDVDTAVLDRIFAAFLVYVGAQGVADVGKGAAQVREAAFAALPSRAVPAGLESGAVLVRNPQAGFAPLWVPMTLAICGFLAVLVGMACTATRAKIAAIEAGVVTCARGDGPAAKALSLEFGTEALADLLAGKTEAQIWAHVSADAEAAAKTQGLAVASCAFGDLIADLDKLLHPAPTPGTAMQGLAATAMVDPIAGGRAALAAFAAAHQIARIDP